MNIEQEKTINGWTQFTLSNDYGMCVGVLDYGGIVTHMITPDRQGNLENIVLGYERIQDYADNPNYLGATIGRTAGRIKGASFTINNQNFYLDQNEGSNHLHGGHKGFSRVVWESEPFQNETAVGVTMTHTSPPKATGYPGHVTATVTYTLTHDNAFTIAYNATTDETTPIILTNHSYFNLSGDLKARVHDHLVTIESDYVAELDQNMLPTGTFLPVADTTFDFKGGRRLTDGLNTDSSADKTDDWASLQQTVVGGGYDHYFLLNQSQASQMSVMEQTSGRKMTITTDQPGVVMYTANGLDTGLNLRGGYSQKHLGVCFETQAHPAALHHNNFPPVLTCPEQPYQTQTTFTFSTI